MPEHVLVTTGGQQVLELMCRVFVDPGDVVIAEGPTYPGMVPTLMAHQADVRQIDTDADGMRIDLLEEELARLDREGRVPKLIYTIPSFHNPAGVTMSEDRRRRLVEIAAARNLVVLEDNPYGRLRFEGEPLPTLAELDAGRGHVVYLGTFSKILAPGLRLGYAVAPQAIAAKLNLAKQGIDLCSSPLSQMLAARFVDGPRFAPFLATLIDLYRERRDVMVAAIRDGFPPDTEMAGAGRRAVPVGAPARRLHRRPAAARAQPGRRVRARRGGLRRRPRRRRHAAELLGGHVRPDRGGRPQAELGDRRAVAR